MAKFTPRNVAVTDQVLAVLDEAYPLPVSTGEVEERTGYGIRYGQPPKPPHEQADKRSVTATGTCPHCSPGDLTRAQPRRAPGTGGPVNGRFQTRTHSELWHARSMPLRPEITTPHL